jgi:spermidine synthase
VIILAKKFFKQFEEGYYDKIDLRVKDAVKFISISRIGLGRFIILMIEKKI